MDRRLSRRELIAGGAALAGAAALGSRPLIDSTPARAASRGRVVVLGGGLAGLAAAWKLEQAGFEAQLVEARTRLGGRVLPVRDLAGGQHGEAGGEFIDSRHTAIRGLCDRFDLPLEDAYRGFAGLAATTHRHGRSYLGRDFRSARDERRIRRFWREVEELARPLRGADPTANGGRAQDRRTVADLFDQLGIDGRARWLLANRIRSDYGFDVGRLSLLYVTISERIAHDQPDSGVERYRVRGGNSRLVDALSRRLVTPPMLDSPVERVRWGGSGVELGLAGGGTVSGDRLVLAAPTDALRRIVFVPRLPERQASAIAAIRLCPVAKTLVQFDRRAWRAHGRTGGSTTDLAIGQTWEATDQQPGRRGILIAYMTGTRAERAKSLTDERRIGQARRQVPRVFKGTRGRSGDAATVSWTSEPYSGGGWAAYSPGQISRHWLALHDPVGPIHMAGEHTERLSGYMNSAVASGLRAAGEIGRG